MPNNSAKQKKESPVDDVLPPIERFVHLVSCMQRLQKKMLDEFGERRLTSQVWSASLESELCILNILPDLMNCFESMKLMLQNPQEQLPLTFEPKVKFREIIGCLVYFVNKTINHHQLGSPIGDTEEDFRKFFVSNDVLDVFGLKIETEKGAKKMEIPVFPSEEFFKSVFEKLPKELQDSFCKDMQKTSKKKKGKKANIQRNQIEVEKQPSSKLPTEKQKRIQAKIRSMLLSSRLDPQTTKCFNEILDTLEDYIDPKNSLVQPPLYEYAALKEITHILFSIVNTDKDNLSIFKSVAEKIETEVIRIRDELKKKDIMYAGSLDQICELTTSNYRLTLLADEKTEEAVQKDEIIKQLNEQVRRLEASKMESNFQKTRSKKEATEKDNNIKMLEKQIKDYQKAEEQRMKNMETSTEKRYQEQIEALNEEIRQKNECLVNCELQIEKEKNKCLVGEEAFQNVNQKLNAAIQMINHGIQQEKNVQFDEMEALRNENRRLNEANKTLSRNFQQEQERNQSKDKMIRNFQSNLQRMTSSGQSQASSSSTSPTSASRPNVAARTLHHDGKSQQFNGNSTWQSHQNNQNVLLNYGEFNPVYFDQSQEIMDRWTAENTAGASMNGLGSNRAVDDLQRLYDSMGPRNQYAQNGGKPVFNVVEETERLNRQNEQMVAQLKLSRSGHGAASSSIAQQIDQQTPQFCGNGGFQWNNAQNGQGTSSNTVAGQTAVMGQSIGELVPEYPPPVPFDACLPPNHEKRRLLNVFKPTGDNSVAFSLLSNDNDVNKYF